MILIRLALLSLANRRLTALLTIFAIAFSVTLLLAVEKVRTGARSSFADTISGTDLIVGARSGSLNLLLYSVFRIGDATNNISWKSYRDIASLPEVAWIVPISLGDSHHGFRVLGTSPDYFDHFHYRRGQGLVFSSGGRFIDLFDAVVGAEVAEALRYRLGDPIIIAHGLGSVSFMGHEDKPFRVAGVLARTGTPVDRTVHVSVEAIEAIHLDWQSGAPISKQNPPPDAVRARDLTPHAITAAFVGLKSRLAAFRLQRTINDYPEEPLTAVLPGVALQELWSLVGTAEAALSAISAMVVVTALLGMVTMVLSSLNERRREMAILRSVGARPLTIVGLLVWEAFVLTTAGVVLGTALYYCGLVGLQPYIDRTYGLHLTIEVLGTREFWMLGMILGGGLIAGLLPAIRAYNLSIADGITVRT